MVKRTADCEKMSKFKSLWSSDRQDWRTPEALYDLLNAEFHFDFDPCPNNPASDGLALESWGNVNFVNPPYRQVARWVAKAYEQSKQGRTVVLLVAARTDTRWFHNIVLPFSSEIRFIKGRLKFSNSKNSAPFPSCVIIFKGKKDGCK